MNILFSLIGNTDLIKPEKDGPLLNILRCNQMDLVYLVLTKKMTENEQRNKAYSEGISYFCARLGYKIKIVLKETNITDPHLYGRFDEIFIKIFDEIHEKHKEDNIFINMTSGTPQMLASLYTLTTQVKFKTTLIQVTSPSFEKIKNEYIEFEPKDVIDMVINNVDDKRCHEINNDSIARYFVFKEICTLCEAYDYKGAKRVFQENKRLFNERIGLQINEAYNRLYWKEDYNNSKYNNEEKIYYYILYLYVKEKQKFIGEFARALSPLLKDLAILLLTKIYKINLNELKIEGKIAYSKLNERMKKEYDRFFLDKYKDSDLSFSSITPLFMCDIELESKDKRNRIISILGSDGTLTQPKGLFKFEKKIRNESAHEIQMISDKKVFNICNRTTQGIVKNIIELYEMLFGIKNWNYFEEINNAIYEEGKCD